MAHTDNLAVLLATDVVGVSELLKNTLENGNLGLGSSLVESVGRSLTSTGTQPVVSEGGIAVTCSDFDLAVLGSKRVVPVAGIETDTVDKVEEGTAFLVALLGRAVVALDTVRLDQVVHETARSMFHGPVGRSSSHFDDLTADVRKVGVIVVHVGQDGKLDVDGDVELDILALLVVETVRADLNFAAVAVAVGSVFVASLELDRGCSGKTEEGEEREEFAAKHGCNRIWERDVRGLAIMVINNAGTYIYSDTKALSLCEKSPH